MEAEVSAGSAPSEAPVLGLQVTVTLHLPSVPVCVQMSSAHKESHIGLETSHPQ